MNAAEAPPIRPDGSKAIVTGNQHYAGVRNHPDLWNQDFQPGCEITIEAYDPADGSYLVSPESPGGWEWVDALDLADVPEPWRMPLWQCETYRIAGETPAGTPFRGHLSNVGTDLDPWQAYVVCSGLVVVHQGFPTSQAAKRHVADVLRGL